MFFGDGGGSQNKILDALFFSEKCPSKPGHPNFSKLPTPLHKGLHSLFFKLPKVKLEFAKQSYYSGAKIYNDLPIEKIMTNFLSYCKTIINRYM